MFDMLKLVKMEAENSSRNVSDSDEELTRLAVEKILEETKMAAMRADRVGTFGWQPSQKSVNKKFLQHTLLFNALHNKRKDMAKLRKSTPSSSSKSS